MISIKKYLDRDSGVLLASALAAYRSALITMSEACMVGDPEASLHLQAHLITIVSGLPEPVTEKVLRESQSDVTEDLKEWRRCTAERLQQAANDVRDLLVALAGTANAVGNHDREYASRLTALTGRLETIAQWDDVSRIRQSVLESVDDLKSCVSQIVRESDESVSRFKAQLSTYEIKLHESEQRTLRDSLTGLFNRDGVERILARRITDHRSFSIVMVDLNNFKSVNDRYGHAAGDELLKLFSEELRSSSRSSDVLARWGGDEFVLILDCDMAEASALLQRMDSWLGGEYSIQVGTETYRASIGASFGLAAWQEGDTIEEILLRADKAMYLNKYGGKRLEKRCTPVSKSIGENNRDKL